MCFQSLAFLDHSVTLPCPCPLFMLSTINSLACPTYKQAAAAAEWTLPVAVTTGLLAACILSLACMGMVRAGTSDGRDGDLEAGGGGKRRRGAGQIKWAHEMSQDGKRYVCSLCKTAFSKDGWRRHWGALEAGNTCAEASKDHRLGPRQGVCVGTINQIRYVF